MATFKQLGPKRLLESLAKARNLSQVTPGFGVDSWIKFYEMIGLAANFTGVKIPVIPMKGLMLDHDRHEFRRFVIAVSAEVTLERIFSTTKTILQLIGADVIADEAVQNYIVTSSGRRQTGPYLIRYKDSTDYCNFYTDVTIDRIVRKKCVSTMNLLEALLRLNYYIVAHGRLPDDKLGFIACPEDVIGNKVIIVRLDDTPFTAAQSALTSRTNKKVTELSALSGIPMSQTKVKLHLDLKELDSPFRWNEKPLMIIK